MSPENEAWAAVRANQRIWLLNVLGNAVLAAAVYGWFWIPDEKAWQLVLSAAAALVIPAALIWLYGITVAALEGGARRLARCALWLAALALWIELMMWLSGFGPRMAAWLASLLTMLVQRPVSPAITTAVTAGLWPVVLAAGILLLVPFGSLSARKAWRVYRSGRYWLGSAVLLLAGFYLPWKLAMWAPKIGGITMQARSMVLRFGIAWVVAVTAWLLLLALAGRFAGTGREAPVEPA